MAINELKDKVLAAIGQATGSTRDIAGKAATKEDYAGGSSRIQLLWKSDRACNRPGA